MANPFVEENETLIKWFEEATNAAPGIYVIVGPIGSAISSTADKLVTSLKGLDKKCCVGLARDRLYFEDAVKLANSGCLVVITMIAESIDNAIGILESYKIEDSISLIHGYIFQRMDKSSVVPKLVTSYTKTDRTI